MRVRVARAWTEASAIRAFSLTPASDDALAPFDPGAHVEVTIPLAGGPSIRRYSLACDPEDHSHYRIAVLREARGRGGSAFLHDGVKEGDALEISPPRNEFPLDERGRHSVLIAGGIGVTPILSMGSRLATIGASYELHYAARSPSHAAFVQELRERHGDRLRTYFSGDGERIDLSSTLGPFEQGVHAYVCGPRRLIKATQRAAAERGWPLASVRFESFGARALATDRLVRVELRLSGLTIDVPVGTSILDAMLEAGVFAPYECRRGECGSCASIVASGEPDHRDHCLTDQQRHSLVCTCVSWSKTDHLALEL